MKTFKEIIAEGVDKKTGSKVAKEFLAAAKNLQKLEKEFGKITDGESLIPDDIGSVEQIIESAKYLDEMLNDSDFYEDL